jgi:Xaa-Pro aminopeptidase
MRPVSCPGCATKELDVLFNHAAMRRRLSAKMEEAGVAALFLAPSADLEYLTGIERQVPNFGQASYTHGWVTGAFFRPHADPIFLFPRMVAAFDMREQPEGEVLIVNETDDGYAAFARVAKGIGVAGSVAIGDRVWSETTINLAGLVGLERLEIGSHLVNELRRVKDPEELAAMGRAIATVEQAMAYVTPLTVAGVSMAELVEHVEHGMRRAGSRTPSFTTHTFTGFERGDLDSGTETGWDVIPEGTSVMFDFGGVVDGYCSDFGRTIYVGDPSDEYRQMYGAVLAAQDAGRIACVPGATAREVNAACRKPIEDAGWGEHFRHRMGHGIGMDVHELPFVSSEDETPLQAGMTFTDEPSIFIPNTVGLRIEDIIVCQDGEGRMLNSYSRELVATA